MLLGVWVGTIYVPPERLPGSVLLLVWPVAHMRMSCPHGHSYRSYALRIVVGEVLVIALMWRALSLSLFRVFMCVVVCGMRARSSICVSTGPACGPRGALRLRSQTLSWCMYKVFACVSCRRRVIVAMLAHSHCLRCSSGCGWSGASLLACVVCRHCRLRACYAPRAAVCARAGRNLGHFGGHVRLACGVAMFAEPIAS